MAVAPAHMQPALVAVPKVTGLDEAQLVPLGFRSQKDLSIVSQQDVWRLVDGNIGSDQSLCTMCIRNKAVAPRHATVRVLAVMVGFPLRGGCTRVCELCILCLCRGLTWFACFCCVPSGMWGLLMRSCTPSQVTS